MARRKKRGPPGKEAGDNQNAAPEQKRTLPPARPPRKNLPLLLLCSALFAVWLTVLLILALFYS